MHTYAASDYLSHNNTAALPLSTFVEFFHLAAHFLIDFQMKIVHCHSIAVSKIFVVLVHTALHN